MRSKKVRRQEDKHRDKGKKKWWGEESWRDCVLMEQGLGNTHYKITWVPHAELTGI